MTKIMIRKDQRPKRMGRKSHSFMLISKGISNWIALILQETPILPAIGLTQGQLCLNISNMSLRLLTSSRVTTTRAATTAATATTAYNLPFQQRWSSTIIPPKAPTADSSVFRPIISKKSPSDAQKRKARKANAVHEDETARQSKFALSKVCIYIPIALHCNPGKQSILT